jgi:putative tryptophan/tyrosine transport system substrate-binding protein
MMRRRGFITLVGGAAVTWPLTALAQKAPIVIGFLGSQAPPPSRDAQGRAIEQGFLENGLVEGRDYVVENRFTGGDEARFPELARELAQKNVRIIMTNTPAGVRAAQRLDPPVPVIMTNMNDPVGAGLIASLAHPGNHTTGTASLNEDVTPKLLEFVREIVPKASVLAVLFNPQNPTNPMMMDNLRAKAAPFGITVFPFGLKSPDELEAAFDTFAIRRPDALQIISDPRTSDLGDRIAALAIAHRLPTFSNNLVFVEAGCLMSYSASLRKILRRTGYYVKKILDGANAGDLPVEQPTGLELFINLKTAKALGIEIPPTLLARADQVIE